MRNRDEAAFLATVDPASPPEFQRQQRELFHNLSGVPLAEWSYTVASHSEPSPLVSVPLTVPADEVFTPQVDLRYALAGVDVVPTQREIGFLFTRRGNTWYVAGDDHAQAAGPRPWHGPWDFGPSWAVPTVRGLVLGHEENHELAQRVARVVDESVAAVTQVWGPQWPQRVGILVPSSQGELQALVGPEFAVDGIAAVAIADRVDNAARRVEGPRIVLNPKTVGQLSDSALRVVLRHEITHVAARADTVDGAPMWLLEGFADYVGYRDSRMTPGQIAPDLARQLQQHRGPVLPSDRDFHLSGHKLDMAYQQSWAMVDFLARRWGEQRLVAMYRDVAGSGSADTVDAALHDLTGMHTPAVLAAWNEDLRRTLR